MKKKLLVSFSGGETSAFMAIWIWRHLREEYDIIFVFANTGQENEETLLFVKRVSEYYGFPVVWIEALVNSKNGIGNSFKVVDFHSASRAGEPFEAIIKKHGIPNVNMPHCTRELKQVPIRAYAKAIGWKGLYMAIGIRVDEIDRMNSKFKENRFIYPLIHKHMLPTTKPMVNLFWSQQPFRLELKGYQGNCVTCWKKSDHKLFTIAKENERAFLFMDKMEARYGRYTPESRLKLMTERDELPVYPVNFFRGNRSARDIVNQSKSFSGRVIDDAATLPAPDLFDLIGGESCEVFSSCESQDEAINYKLEE